MLMKPTWIIWIFAALLDYTSYKLTNVVLTLKFSSPTFWFCPWDSSSWPWIVHSHPAFEAYSVKSQKRSKSINLFLSRYSIFLLTVSCCKSLQTSWQIHHKNIYLVFPKEFFLTGVLVDENMQMQFQLLINIIFHYQ